MANSFESFGIPGLSAITGMVLGWFGLKSKICRVDKDLSELKKNIVFTDVFIQFEKGLDSRLINIEKMQTETGKDLKEVLKRLPTT